MREGYLEHRQLTTWIEDNKMRMEKNHFNEEETESQTKNNTHEFLEDFKRFGNKKR